MHPDMVSLSCTPPSSSSPSQIYSLSVSLENKLLRFLRDNNKRKYKIIKQARTKTNTLELDKRSKQKEKCARKGTWIRDPLVPTLRNPLKSPSVSLIIYTEDLLQICAGPVHPASVSVSSYFVDIEGLVALLSWCLLFPLALTFFPPLSASSSMVFPELWGGEFDGDISFKADSSKVSHSLCVVWLWVSVFVRICFKRKCLWWWLRKALTYSNKSLVVILLQYSFSRVVFGFALARVYNR